jgi:hypothetical protein
VNDWIRVLVLKIVAHFDQSSFTDRSRSPVDQWTVYRLVRQSVHGSLPVFVHRPVLDDPCPNLSWRCVQLALNKSVAVRIRKLKSLHFSDTSITIVLITLPSLESPHYAMLIWQRCSEGVHCPQCAVAISREARGSREKKLGCEYHRPTCK